MYVWFYWLQQSLDCLDFSSDLFQCTEFYYKNKNRGNIYIIRFDRQLHLNLNQRGNRNVV